MSERKEGWYIFVTEEDGLETEVAHHVCCPAPPAKPEKTAICGHVVPFDLSGMEPWLASNPQHISEIRQCTKCQAAIAIRDGRKPMEELYVSASRSPFSRAVPDSRAKRKGSAKKVSRRTR